MRSLKRIHTSFETFGLEVFIVLVKFIVLVLVVVVKFDDDCVD